MKVTVEIEIQKKDYDILTKYGYYFEKNFEEVAKDVARQLREHHEYKDN